MMDEGAANDRDAASDANETAVVAPPAAASSMSGHKRTADSYDSTNPAPSSAAASAAASLFPDSMQPADVSSEQQRKKQRGGSQSQDSSAAAASPVGFEPPAAAASASSKSAEDRPQAQRPEESSDERRFEHWKQHRGQYALGAAIASSSCVELQPHSRSAATHRLCSDAQQLTRVALPFADAQVLRYSPTRAAEVKRRMQELAAAEAELRSTPAAATADPANQRALKQSQIAAHTTWLKLHGGFTYFSLCTINDARVAIQQPADLTAIVHLGRLCFIFVSDVRSWLGPLAAKQQRLPRNWFLRVDELFTRLCSAIPHMSLSLWQSYDLLYAAEDCGALQLIPSLMRGQIDRGFPIRCIGAEPVLTDYCLHSAKHAVSLQPICDCSSSVSIPL